MTLREEIIDLSKDQQLDEGFLELGQAALNYLIRVAEPMAELGVKVVNLVANPAVAGTTAAAATIGAVIATIINNRMKAKRVIQSLKINTEDKSKIEQIVNSSESEQTKKNWIIRILSKYAVKAKDSAKQAIQAEKDYRHEKKNIRNWKEEQRKAKELVKDQNKYIRHNFGSEEKYKQYQEWKSNR